MIPFFGVLCPGHRHSEHAAGDDEPEQKEHNAASLQPRSACALGEEQAEQDQRQGDADDGMIDRQVQRPDPVRSQRDAVQTVLSVRASSWP